jgi:DnaJ-class molecular chaperone
VIPQWEREQVKRLKQEAARAPDLTPAEEQQAEDADDAEELGPPCALCLGAGTVKHACSRCRGTGREP